MPNKLTLKVLDEHLAEVESLARTNADNIAENVVQTQGSLKVLRLDLEAFADKATVALSKAKYELSDTKTELTSCKALINDLQVQLSHQRLIISILSIGVFACGIALGFLGGVQ